MPPKKRIRTASLPAVPATPEKSAAIAKHAKTESRPSPRHSSGTNAAGAGSPAPQRSITPQRISTGTKARTTEHSKSLALSVTKTGDSTTRSDFQSIRSKRTVRPLKLLNANDDDGAFTAADDDHKHQAAAASTDMFAPTNTVKDLEAVVLRSSVIAPDVSGIACIAANHDESEVVAARENGSLVLYSVEFFQNIPHFTQIRSTGGRVRRSITRMAFLDLSAHASPTSGWKPHRYFVASYLSGQLVIYDSETLFPVSVYQRTGGAVWDFTVVQGDCIYAALADGSWHRLRATVSRSSQPQQGPQQLSPVLLRPKLELERVIPRITGADRALTVAASAKLRMVVGTDDGGNVHTWRHADSSSSSSGHNAAEKESSWSGGGAAASLSSHETLWTRRLPRGIAMSCCVVDGGTVSTRGSSGSNTSNTTVSNGATTATGTAATGIIRPIVAVGTSMGDVILIDAQHGHVLHTFATHKGPVSTVVCEQHVLYASGWHESLRAFRCSVGGAEDGEWYPAEVKRRTHYHEATQLLVLSQRQLMLSAARDGTVMFSPLARLFSSPAMYMQVTTQRFALAQEKNVLLQTRLDRIEAFRMDAALRHWTPLFAHNIHGKFHLNGLWCDPRLHFIVFSTDERVVVSRVVWREGAEAALAIVKIEEVRELPAGRGLIDVAFVPHSPASTDATAVGGDEDTSARGNEGSLYLLFDDYVLYVTLSEGFPVIRTELATSGSGPNSTAEDIRPMRLVQVPTTAAAPHLTVYGVRGTWRCELAVDGTPNPDMAHCATGPAATFTHVQVVPVLCTDKESAAPTTQGLREAVIGLGAADGRYTKSITVSSGTTASTLPKTLPHDITFVASLPRATKATSGKEGAAENYVGYFSKGLVLVGAREWRMAARATVEAAFIMKDRRHLLILERNLEKTLEALPLCWKVRRFGN